MEGSVVHPFSHYPHKSMVLVDAKRRQETFRIIVPDTRYILEQQLPLPVEKKSIRGKLDQREFQLEMKQRRIWK